MLIGTHALLPACTCLLADHVSLAAGRDRIFPTSGLWLVAVCGVIPDLCSPHISLEARYASGSHTLWFLAGWIVVAAMAGSFFVKGSRLPMALACWLAAALHLAADAASGGIAWLHPWRNEVIGSYWIPPQYWIASDAGFVLLTWLLVRTLPHLEARRICRRSIAEPSVEDS